VAIQPQKERILTNEYILEIDDVTKDFPGVRALANVSFKVKRGEIHGLCGENGAGKSTLIKILSGVYPYGTYEGHIYLKGEELKLLHESIHEAIKKGIAVVYQELALIPYMTVGENIYLGREPATKQGIINWHQLYSDTQKILERYHLNIPFAARVSTLGVGKQQMVEIAKALSEDAKILILDEPTSALTEAEVDTLMKILRHLKASGVTCIYISHKLEEFFRITDHITVLRDGKTVDTVPTSETTREKIIAMMVGREMKERFPISTRKPGKTILEIRNLTAYDPNNPEKKSVDHVSFSVREGEILGIAGLMGSGRTELVTTIFGEYGVNVTGEIVLHGKPLDIQSARDAMNSRISLVPEDRKALGLILLQSLLQNISLPNIQRFSTMFRINKHKEIRECQKFIQYLAIKTPSITTIVNTLSGGNQQKVVIAKWLMSEPKILIMDEPTRGIDVGAKYEIYRLMNTLAEEGVGIMMVSSELPEILGMSDRILVMDEGQCAGIVNRAEATQENIMALATGMTRASGGGI
jgi:D-xylose transport system ATP-binding protein